MKVTKNFIAALFFALLFTVFTPQIHAEEAVAAAAPEKEEAAEAEEEIPPGLKVYMGRKIAQTMHWMGAEWLTRTRREREEAGTVMFEQLKIKPGQRVCDMGCGNGYYTLPMAKAVGKEGRVYAVDIQKEMLTMLRRRADKEELENIIYVHGELHDPKLPRERVDLLLMVDVYHEFSHPVHMLKAIRESLAPGGRVALVEYRAEDDTVPIKPDHKMSKKQIMKEYTANGFKLVESFDELPWQHLMFFEVAEDPEEGAAKEK